VVIDFKLFALFELNVKTKKKVAVITPTSIIRLFIADIEVPPNNNNSAEALICLKISASTAALAPIPSPADMISVIGIRVRYEYLGKNPE
jgi:hypothetical protein